MSSTIQHQIEYTINAPKTKNESVTLTKQIISIIVSQIILDRKIFGKSKYIKRSVLGIPVKIITCTTSPETQFSLCLKTALSELKTQNLQSLKIIIVSKETNQAIEEYCINFKYNGEAGIDIDMSQGDQSVMTCNSEDIVMMKQSIVNILKNETNFVNSVDPLPDKYLFKMQLFYNKETPIYDPKYFSPKPVEKDQLKDSCVKVKFGKVNSMFGNPLFTARSLLIKPETTTDDEHVF